MPKDIIASAMVETAKDLSPTFFFMLGAYFLVEQQLEYATFAVAFGCLFGLAKYLSRLSIAKCDKKK